MKFIIVVACLPFFSPDGEAQNLQSTEIYKRCFIRMTRDIPSESDPLYIAVKNNTKSAAQACIELFDQAQFTAGGVLKNRSEQSYSILKTFNDLHRSWFQSQVHSFRAGSYLVHDAEEAPLYFTRAAFQPDTEFKSIVTLDSGLTGVRIQEAGEINNILAQRILKYSDDNTAVPDKSQFYVSYRKYTLTATATAVRRSFDGETSLLVPNSRVVEFGRLAGVKPSPGLTLPGFLLTSSGAPDVVAAVNASAPNFNANEHFGGGILGSQAFILNNTNINIGALPDTYSVISRRLSSRVFEDLMCHQLPTLTDADVAAEVKPDSEYVFQKTSSCMRCHSGIDGIGYGYRNLVLFTTASDKSPQGINISSAGRLPASSSATTFAVTAPKGTLHYRELVTGAEIKSSFSSLDQLGTQIADRQDIYYCAAKRYYQFFTGVNVDLTQVATKDIDKVHQDEVIALGKTLKKSQRVRTMLLELFSSPTFKSTNYLTEREQ